MNLLLETEHPRKRIPALLLPLALLVLAGPLAAQDSTAVPPAEKLAGQGAFSAVQAKRGEDAYNSFCITCHSAKEYTGEAFKTAWLGRTTFDIFTLISTTMPDDNPGMLQRQQYTDIVAYMLSLNGYPPAEAELPSDDEGMKRVRIDTLPPRPGAGAGTSAARHRK
jgi:cytochrome c5